jgi:hypothetical protein
MRAKTMRALVLAIAMGCGTALPAWAQQFALQTGPPVAAMPDPASPGQAKLKNIAFVVRSAGCADRTTFRLQATADGVFGGVRQSVPVKVDPLPQAGVFAIFSPAHASPVVVSLSGTCGTQVAGATVRLAAGAYRRDAVELLPHHPTPADIERALARSGGGPR